MKLSEAIETSTPNYPIIKGKFFEYDETGNVCGACAIGAVALQCGYKPVQYESPDSWLRGDFQHFIEECLGTSIDKEVPVPENVTEFLGEQSDYLWRVVARMVDNDQPIQKVIEHLKSIGE